MLARDPIYVVLLRFPSGEFGSYVGMTGLTPEERSLDHKRRHKASKWVRKYGVGLCPALYRHLNPLDRESAIIAEVALAQALASMGNRVEQGWPFAALRGAEDPVEDSEERRE